MGIRWKKNGAGDDWGQADGGSDYLVSKYDHGASIVLTGTDEDGRSLIYRNVGSVREGKQAAEQHDRNRHS